jgi:hypothetical protein
MEAQVRIALSKIEKSIKKLLRDVRTLFTRLTVVEQGQESGVIGYATKADMEADTGQPTGSVAYVTNDPTILNNGRYRYTGSEWVAFSNQDTIDINSRSSILLKPTDVFLVQEANGQFAKVTFLDLAEAINELNTTATDFTWDSANSSPTAITDN